MFYDDIKKNYYNEIIKNFNNASNGYRNLPIDKIYSSTADILKKIDEFVPEEIETKEEEPWYPTISW